MILECLACHTRYLISAQLFATGPRQVRCARCFHSWQAELPKEIDAFGSPPVIDLTPTPEAVAPISPGSNLPALRKKTLPRGLRRALSIGASTVILILLALLLSWLAVERRWVVEKWPAMDSVYDTVGLHIYHYGEGLSFEDVRSELRYEGGRMILEIDGNIHNKASTALRIPDIKATAIGVDGKPVQSWQIAAPAAIVASGGAQKFTSSINAPKDAVTEVTLNFIETGHDSDQ